MPHYVPLRRPDLAPEEIQVGSPVRASTWRSAAELAGWARARGYQVVPGTFSGRRFASGTETFHFKNRPSPWAISRVWVIHAHGVSAPAVIDVAVGSTTLSSLVLPESTWLGASPIVVFEDLAAKVTAITDAQITFTWVSGTIQVDTITAFEMPRFSLDEDATEYGVDLNSLFPQDAIYDAANVSAHAVAELIDDLNPRRIYFQHYGNVWSTSSASYQAMFELEPPILGQKVSSASTETVTWDCYARITAAGDADVQIVAASGDTKAINITHTSFAFIGTSTVDINVEVPTEDDGLPGSAWESFQINGRVNSGGGDLEILGVYVWRDS